MPWWATLVTATLLVRASLLPLTIQQMRFGKRFGAAMQRDEVRTLIGITRQEISRMGDGATAEQKAQKLRLCLKGLRLVWREHDCHPARFFVTPVVHISVFLTYVFSVRAMIREGVPGLDAEGALWFTDLTVPDPVFALPLAAVSLTYANLELGFGSGSQPAVITWIKDKIQLLMIFVALPFTTQLPAGVPIYWVTSASFGLAQQLLLKQPEVRERLGGAPLETVEPPPPSASSPPRDGNDYKS